MPTAPPPPTKAPPNRPHAPPVRRPGPTRRPDPARPGKIQPDERPDMKPKMNLVGRAGTDMFDSRAQQVVDFLLEVKMFSNPMKAYTFAGKGGDHRCKKCHRPMHDGKCPRCSSQSSSVPGSMRTPSPTL